MIMNGATLAFCAFYSILGCRPDDVAKAVMEHLGAPYDQITWCCAGSHWENEKPHTMYCDDPSVDGRDPAWSSGIGSIKMSEARNVPAVRGILARNNWTSTHDYCAIWLHKSVAPIS